MSIKFKNLPSATVPTNTKGDTTTTFKATPTESSTLEALLKRLKQCQDTIEWAEADALVAIALGEEKSWQQERWEEAREQAQRIEAKLQEMGLKPE